MGTSPGATRRSRRVRLLDTSSHLIFFWIFICLAIILIRNLVSLEASHHYGRYLCCFGLMLTVWNLISYWYQLRYGRR